MIIHQADKCEEGAGRLQSCLNDQIENENGCQIKAKGTENRSEWQSVEEGGGGRLHNKAGPMKLFTISAYISYKLSN